MRTKSTYILFLSAKIPLGTITLHQMLRNQSEIQNHSNLTKLILIWRSCLGVLPFLHKKPAYILCGNIAPADIISSYSIISVLNKILLLFQKLVLMKMPRMSTIHNLLKHISRTKSPKQLFEWLLTSENGFSIAFQVLRNKVKMEMKQANIIT